MAKFPFLSTVRETLVTIYDQGKLPVIILDEKLDEERGSNIMRTIMKEFPQGDLFLRASYENKDQYDAWNEYFYQFEETETPQWGFKYFASPTIRHRCNEFLLERGLVENVELENNR